MDRLTTDNPQNNTEALCNLAFVKNSQAWMHCCGEDEKDCTLVSFTKQICEKCGCDSIPRTDDESDFSESIFECAFGLCPIANAYFGLVQAAELRERLKAYEDSGLTPEQAAELAKELEQVKRERDAARAIAAILPSTCDEDCIGDDSAGIPDCPAYEFPDEDKNGNCVGGGCMARKWRGPCAENGGPEQ